MRRNILSANIWCCFCDLLEVEYKKWLNIIGNFSLVCNFFCIKLILQIIAIFEDFGDKKKFLRFLAKWLPQKEVANTRWFSCIHDFKEAISTLLFETKMYRVLWKIETVNTVHFSWYYFFGTTFLSWYF